MDGTRTRVGTPVPWGRVVLVALVLGGGGWALRLVTPIRLPLPVLLVPVLGVVLVRLALGRLHHPRGGPSLVVGLPVLALVAAVVVPALVGVAPVPPAGLSAEVGDLPLIGPGDRLGAAVDAAIVVRDADGTTSLAIQFAEVRTTNGYWAYDTGQVTSDSFRGVARAPGIARDWGSTISVDLDRPTESVTPHYEVDLPLGPELEGTTITVGATMSLHYPSGGLGTFVEVDEDLRREVRLRVASADEGAFRSALDDWRDRRFVVERYPVPLAGSALFGALLVVVGGVRLTRVGRRAGDAAEVVGRSGLIVRDVVRLPRTSTTTVPLRTGMVLGAARVASPAERAEVRADDLLVAVDDRPVDTVAALRAQVARWAPGEPHRLVLLRDGGVRVLDIVL